MAGFVGWYILVLFLFLKKSQVVLAAGNGSVVVTFHNIHEILNSNELVLLSFYTNWCRFSQLLQPIFEAAAREVHRKFPEPGRVVFGRVECEEEEDVSNMFDITKYPTLKVARHGFVSNKEYRGQRSVEAFVQYVEKELSDPIKEFTSIPELNSAEGGEGLVVGYFENKLHPEYDNFRKAASLLRYDCKYVVGFGNITENLRPPKQNLIIFRADASTANHREYYSEYSGNMNDFRDLVHWIREKCKPLVRELTFDNAEEFSEEGLPFVILFYNEDDTGPIQEFKAVVHKVLADEKRVNFLSANGKLFIHPLYHIDKTLEDLPLIAIDSFRHMYSFPRFEDIHQPGKLQQFINDLFSGKLHIDFHRAFEENEVKNIDPEDFPPVPHESKFKELLPSKHRYTLINRSRDEL
ncbi:endoplasmic reticulum resident protein 44 [Drosophila bipectinata]|uniref:endoplasmic reticulum resident protein 44 n=1 Tax=Drosophila bipectinata TaxID=42026 RepID=UPI001C89A053|nr:endoplasmic reticulum resident protein 44 [Drosophila bipectinata]